MQKLHRLRLYNLLDLRSSPTELPHSLSNSVETISGPSKTLSSSRFLSMLFAPRSLATTTNAKVDSVFGGPGEVLPFASRIPLLQRDYSYNMASDYHINLAQSLREGYHNMVVRAERIELSTRRWQRPILPLNYARILQSKLWTESNRRIPIDGVLPTELH